MTVESITELDIGHFAALFVGRLDAYGTEGGGAVHVDPADVGGYVERIRRHLGGTTPTGVYPYVNGYVHWGCVDFDEGEERSWVHAVNLHNALAAFGIQGWIERSRSKGYHVWVFGEGWVPAPTMRRALLVACQVAGAPTREVNPKSETLADGQLGNYVRLPYPGGTGMRRSMYRPAPEPHAGGVVTLAEFLESVIPVDGAALDLLAEMWQPPAPPPRPQRTYTPRDGSTAMERVSGLTKTIIEGGPLEGADRSGTLFKLAVKLCGEAALSDSERLDLLIDADLRWGKFMARPDGEQRLQKMLDDAWRLS